MTPKEWKFVEHVISESCKWAYEHGHRDGMAGNPLNTQQFKLSKADMLKLKSEHAKYTKSA